LGMLPWSLMLLPLAWSLVRRFRPASVRRPAGLGLFLIATVWCFVFYSLAGSKRSGYILPVMPPLALALGCYLDGLLATAFSRILAFRVAIVCGGGVFAVLLAALHLALPQYAVKFALRERFLRIDA